MVDNGYFLDIVGEYWIFMVDIGIITMVYKPKLSKNWVRHHLVVWVNLITTSLFSRALESWLIGEIIPFDGHKIQVRELL